MLIVATLLFGSHARAEKAEGSDTDILLINLDDETRHVSARHLSFFVYPWTTLERNARAGDLFICHLVREAKALLDPNNYLQELRNIFRFRSHYQEDIQHAADLGWYLVRFGDDTNMSLQIKRVLWCIRTILIARSAEMGDPVFAPKQLAERTASAAARELLYRRHHHHDVADLRASLRQFLIAEAPFSFSLLTADRDYFVRRFEETSNAVALQTIKKELVRKAIYVT